MERINGRCRNLIYEEAGNQLIIGLEISGVRKFDWVGTDTSFEKWTVPKEELIPESKRREILNRLAEWGQANRLRIDIGPPVSMEEMYADYEKKGWTVQHKADGSTLVTPPKRESLLKRILQIFTFAGRGSA
jgi:hypothetical protein